MEENDSERLQAPLLPSRSPLVGQRLRKSLLWVLWCGVLLDFCLESLVVPIFPYVFPTSSGMSTALWFSTRPLYQAVVCHWLQRPVASLFDPRLVFAVGMVLLAVSACLMSLAIEDHGSSSRSDTGGSEFVFRKAEIGFLMNSRFLQTIASMLVMIGAGGSASGMYKRRRTRRAARNSVMSAIAVGSLCGPLIAGASIQAHGAKPLFQGFAVAVACGIGMFCVILALMRNAGGNVVPSSFGEPLAKRTSSARMMMASEVSNPNIALVHGEHGGEEGRPSTVDTVGASSTDAEDEYSWTWMSFLCDAYVLVAALWIVVSQGLFSLLEPLIPQFFLKRFDLEPIETAGIWTLVPLVFLIITPVASRQIESGARRMHVFFTGIGLYAISFPFLTESFFGGASVVGSSLSLVFVSSGTAVLLAIASEYLRDVFVWRYGLEGGVDVVFVKQTSNAGAFLGPLVGQALVDLGGHRVMMLVLFCSCIVLASLTSLLFLRHVPRRHQTIQANLPL